MQSTLFTTRHSSPDKEQSLRFEGMDAPIGVGKMRVATINHDISRREHGHDLCEHIVDRAPGRDHQQDLSRQLQRFDEGWN